MITDLERGVGRAPYRDTVRMLADALRLDDRERATFEATARIFTAAWDEGCALTLDAAVELALRQPNGEPPAALE